jgi:ribosomal protein S6--L-glutamate ligase
MKKKKIAVLASDRTLYSNQRLMEEGSLLGFDMHFVPITECCINLSLASPEVHIRSNKSLSGFDAVIPRIRPSITNYATAVLRQFELTGAFCLNHPAAILNSRNKLLALQLLVSNGIDMPVTGFANSPLDTKALIKMVGGAPIIIKLLEGTQGKGVILAETDKAAESVINAFKTLRANILVQKFVKEAQNCDIRCFVLGDQVVAAMQRQAAEGEFRANLHLGGTASPVEITEEEREMAVKAAHTMGLVVAGVDLIRAHDGSKVLEVNSSPGLEGIEKATGLNIAGMMIAYIDKAISKGRARA